MQYDIFGNSEDSDRHIPTRYNFRLAARERMTREEDILFTRSLSAGVTSVCSVEDDKFYELAFSAMLNAKKRGILIDNCKPHFVARSIRLHLGLIDVAYITFYDRIMTLVNETHIDNFLPIKNIDFDGDVFYGRGVPRPFVATGTTRYGLDEYMPRHMKLDKVQRNHILNSSSGAIYDLHGGLNIQNDFIKQYIANQMKNQMLRPTCDLHLGTINSAK